MSDLDDGIPRETKSDSDAKPDEVHARAMRRFDAIWNVERLGRAQNLFDRRFATVRGAQWDGQGAPLDAEDDADGGPARMEVPKHLRPLRRVRGEYRASRKTVDFRPIGDDSDRASANNLDGLYRADENDSRGGGQAAYDNAFNEASSGGIGGWRYRSRWDDDTDEENEKQRIAIDPIYDADQSLFFDVNAKAQDKSDAKHAFLLFTMTPEAFEDEYPDADVTSWEKATTGYGYEWVTPDLITLAEYFEVEDHSVTRITMGFKALDRLEDDELKPEERTFDEAELAEKQEGGMTLRSELQAQGWRQVRKRKVRRTRVRKYLLNGVEVLDDEGYIAGPNIPLVPYYFERSYINGVEHTQGMVRPVIDAVRINNLVVSNLAEAANGPTTKTPIFAPEQVDEGIGQHWANRKRERPAYLLAKPIYDAEGNNVIAAGPTAWLEPDEIQPATAALVQMMSGTIDELMGVNAASETVPANTSAQAIELVNDRGDVNELLWHDNFAQSMRRGGEVWMGMAKKLYVERDRKMVAIDQHGKQSTITLGEPRSDDGGSYLTNDLTAARFDVIVDVGPATKTRRDATVKATQGLAEAYTTAGNVDNANAALGIAVLNMEGEGIEQFQEYVRKQGVNGGWVEPTEDEKQAMEAAQQNAQPDPNTLLAQAQMVAAQAEQAKAENGRLEAQARILTAQASAKKAEADAIAALASVDRDDRAQLLAEVRAETDSDRADDKLRLEAAGKTMEVERHDRDMSQPEVEND